MCRVTVNLEPVPLNFYAPLVLSRNVDDTTWERVLKQSLIRRKEKESVRTVLRGAVVVVVGWRCLFIGRGPPGILEYTLREKKVRGPYPGKPLTYRCKMMGFEVILRLTNKVSSYT